MNSSEAFAAIALAAVGCDGILDRQEARALRIQLDGRTPYRDLSDQDMVTMFDKHLQSLRDEGWQALVTSAIPVLSEAQQETALAMAAHLVHCNRKVTSVEIDMLQSISDQMRVSKQKCHIILDVIRILNCDSLAE